MFIEKRKFDYKKFFSLPRCAGQWVSNGAGCLLTAFWHGLGYSIDEQNKMSSNSTVNEDGSITFNSKTPFVSYPLRDMLIFETDVLAAKALGHKYTNGFPMQIESIAPIAYEPVILDDTQINVSNCVHGVYCPIRNESIEFTDAVINNFDNGNVSLAYDLMAELIQTVWGINLLETDKIDELVCQAT